MHRSGTSMVARMLNLCGLYLGPESEFMPPGPDNPEGYWENIHFVEINNRILAHLDAGWDLAPAVCKGWEVRPQLAPLRKESAELIERFNAHEPWGWKDPRNSLTLPFWIELIPNMKALVVLRNPLEAAQSLQARNFSSVALGLKLWLTHNQSILSGVRPEDRVVTHYDSYFYAPRAELRRVLDLLNIPASEKEVDEACTCVFPSLRHQRVPTEALSSDAPSEILRCYVDLCEQAGPVYQASLRKEEYVPWRLDEDNRIIRARDESIARLQSELAALREQSRQGEVVNRSLQTAIIRLQDELSAVREENAALSESKQATIAQLQTEIEALNQALRSKVEERETLILERNEAITSLQGETAEMVRRSSVLLSQLSAKSAELERITRSYGWRILRRYGSFKYQYLLPLYRMLRLGPYTRTDARHDERHTEAVARRPLR
jgi:hypothetical protein